VLINIVVFLNCNLRLKLDSYVVSQYKIEIGIFRFDFLFCTVSRSKSAPLIPLASWNHFICFHDEKIFWIFFWLSSKSHLLSEAIKFEFFSSWNRFYFHEQPICTRAHFHKAGDLYIVIILEPTLFPPDQCHSSSAEALAWKLQIKITQRPALFNKLS